MDRSIRETEQARRAERRCEFRHALQMLAGAQLDRFDAEWSPAPALWVPRLLGTLRALVDAPDGRAQATALVQLAAIAESWYAVLEESPTPEA